MTWLIWRKNIICVSKESVQFPLFWNLNIRFFHCSGKSRRFWWYETCDKLHACISCQSSKKIISCTKIAWLKQFCLRLCGYLHRGRKFYNYWVLVELFPFSTSSLLSRTISGPNKQVVIYMHGPALLLTIVSCKYNIKAMFFWGGTFVNAFSQFETSL